MEYNANNMNNNDSQNNSNNNNINNNEDNFKPLTPIVLTIQSLKQLLEPVIVALLTVQFLIVA